MVKVKVTDLHAVSLGSALDGTHVSHWWRQGGQSGHDTVMEHHYWNVVVKMLCSSKY